MAVSESARAVATKASRGVGVKNEGACGKRNPFGRPPLFVFFEFFFSLRLNRLSSTRGRTNVGRVRGGTHPATGKLLVFRCVIQRGCPGLHCSFVWLFLFIFYSHRSRRVDPQPAEVVLRNRIRILVEVAAAPVWLHDFGASKTNRNETTFL